MLKEAAYSGHKPILEFLVGLKLADGSTVTSQGLDEALKKATSSGHKPIVKFLVGLKLADGSTVTSQGLN